MRSLIEEGLLTENATQHDAKFFGRFRPLPDLGVKHATQQVEGRFGDVDDVTPLKL